MNKIETILVDDEPKALEILKNKIERYCPELHVIAQTQSPTEAIELIQNLQPKLVFLDIAMPELSGFDVLNKIPNPNFEVIFATAFDNYAVDAIKCCAIGYLIKPISKDDLLIAVKNAINNINKHNAYLKNISLHQNFLEHNIQNKKIAIPNTDGIDFVAINQIIACEGANGYTKIHLTNQKSILSSYNIGYYVKLLHFDCFLHIHKSYLINKEHIQKLYQDGTLLLTNNIKCTVSRNKKNHIFNIINS